MDAQGMNGYLAAQYEETFGTDPATPDLTNVYFEPPESFKAAQNQIESNVGNGTAHPTRPLRGNIDASGGLKTELGAYPGLLYVSVLGSIKTLGNSGTGEALGTALTTPTATINKYTGLITFSAAAHGLAVGDVVKVEGVTAPTGLNDTYLRVMSVADAGTFACRIPLGISGAFTLGAGTVKKVTTPATTYQHIIKAGGVLPPVFWEKGLPDVGKFFKYNGMTGSKFDIDVKQEGMQTLSVDYVGKKETLATSAFDAALTDLGKVSWAGFDGAIEEGGSAIGEVFGGKISLDNQLDGGKYMFGGAGLRRTIPRGKYKLSGSMECVFPDSTLLEKAIDGTETSLKLTYTKGTGAGTAGNELAEIFLPELELKRDTPVISGQGGLMVTLGFIGYYDNSSEATGLQITLKSTQIAP